MTSRTKTFRTAHFKLDIKLPVGNEADLDADYDREQAIKALKPEFDMLVEDVLWQLFRYAEIKGTAEGLTQYNKLKLGDDKTKWRTLPE